MRRTNYAGITLACALLLSACGGSGAERDTSSDPTLPATSSSAAPTTTTPAGPSMNARGNIMKRLGEEGGIFATQDTNGPLAFTFTVDSITADIPCTSDYAPPPENGHFIGIAVRASTSAALTPDHFITMTADDFQVIGPDGITVTDVWGMSGACLAESDGFTRDQLGPAQQYAGTVVIDSPVTSGTLIYKPAIAANGWEWQF